MPRKPRQQSPYIPITRLYNLEDNPTAQDLDLNHSGIMVDLWRFACTHTTDDSIRYQLVAVILSCCQDAVLFEASRISNSPPKSRHDNRQEQAAKRLKEYQESAHKAAESLGQVMNFLKSYQGTPGLNDSLFRFVLQAKPAKIALATDSRPMTDTDIIFSTLKHLQASLMAPAAPAFHNYAFRYGPLSYPTAIYWKGGELPTTARMLALQLVTIARYYSISKTELIICEGLSLISTGKPAHELIDRIVKAVFPDYDEEQEIAKPTERYFKDKHPGLYLIRWPTP